MGLIDDQARRLRAARERAGFSTPAAATRRFGWPHSTYDNHEQGRSPISAERALVYARAYRVPAAFLLFGEDPGFGEGAGDYGGPDPRFDPHAPEIVDEIDGIVIEGLLATAIRRLAPRGSGGETAHVGEGAVEDGASQIREMHRVYRPTGRGPSARRLSTVIRPVIDDLLRLHGAGDLSGGDLDALALSLARAYRALAAAPLEATDPQRPPERPLSRPDA